MTYHFSLLFFTLHIIQNISFAGRLRSILIISKSFINNNKLKFCLLPKLDCSSKSITGAIKRCRFSVKYANKNVLC